MTKHIEPVAWHYLKKAIWDVVVSEELNGSKYVNAWQLTDKIFTAVFAAIARSTQHIDPVCWTSEEQLQKAQADPDHNTLIWGEPLVHHPDVALVRLSDAQAAIAAAEGRGRSEERAKISALTGYIEDANGNKGWIVP